MAEPVKTWDGNRWTWMVPKKDLDALRAQLSEAEARVVIANSERVAAITRSRQIGAMYDEATDRADDAEAQLSAYRDVVGGLRHFLVRTDSVTSWVAHRVNRNVLGAETESDLLRVSAEARRRLAALPPTERGEGS